MATQLATVSIKNSPISKKNTIFHRRAFIVIVKLKFEFYFFFINFVQEVVFINKGTTRKLLNFTLRKRIVTVTYTQNKSMPTRYN